MGESRGGKGGIDGEGEMRGEDKVRRWIRGDWRVSGEIWRRGRERLGLAGS